MDRKSDQVVHLKAKAGLSDPEREEIGEVKRWTLGFVEEEVREGTRSSHLLSVSRHVRTVRLGSHQDRVPHRGSDTQSGAPRAWRLFAHSCLEVQTLPPTSPE